MGFQGSNVIQQARTDAHHLMAPRPSPVATRSYRPCTLDLGGSDTLSGLWFHVKHGVSPRLSLRIGRSSLASAD